MPLTRSKLAALFTLLVSASSVSARTQDTAVADNGWCGVVTSDRSPTCNAFAWSEFESVITIRTSHAGLLVSASACDVYVTGQLFIPSMRETGTVTNDFASDTGAQLWIAGANPTSSGTDIGFSLAAPSRIDLSIFDLAGRRVATLLNETRDAGHSKVRWSAEGCVGPGIYFVRLETGHGHMVQKVVVQR